MATRKFTAENIRDYLHYNPDTGIFHWLQKPGTPGHFSWADGALAGCLAPDGYIKIAGQQAHRLAWFYMTGQWPKHTIDHIDCNRTNNKFSNLRDIPSAAQQQNRSGPQRNHSGKLLGAHYNKANKNWVSHISVGGKCKHLGCFPTAEEAHAAYIEAKRKLHPFGNL